MNESLLGAVSDSSSTAMSEVIILDSSNLNLLTVIGQKNTVLEILLEDWWSVYNRSPFEGIKLIVELLYHSSGWLNFTYQRSGLDERAVARFITQKDEILTSSPASLNDIFCDRFSIFFSSLLASKEYKLLFTESFIDPVCTSCTCLIYGGWLSYRRIAVIAGMKIMKYFQEINENILGELRHGLNTESTTELVNKRQRIINIWYKLFKKLFLRSIKDVNSGIRKVILKEMLDWSIQFPRLLLGQRWKKYLYFSIRDANLENRKIAYYLLHHLFKKKIDEKKQEMLFNYLKLELLHTVSFVKGHNAQVAVSLFKDISKYLTINLSETERATIYLCMFNDSQIIAVTAAQFLMIQLMQISKNSVTLLKYISKFNQESGGHGSLLLMDALHFHIKDKVKWFDWIEFIFDCSASEIVSGVSIYFAYVLISVTNYSPPTRIKYRGLNIKTPQLNENKAQFTKSIGRKWIKLIQMDKIKFRNEALIRMIKLLQYTKMNLTLEVIIPICEVLATFVRTNKDKQIVNECCKSLRHIEFLLEAQTTLYNKVLEVLQDLIRDIITEFLEYLKVPSCTLDCTQTYNRIISVCQHFNFDDEGLWDTVRESLRNAVHNKYSADLITTLLIIIYHRLCFPLKLLLNLKQDGNEDDDNSLDSNRDQENSDSQNEHSETSLIYKINSRAGIIQDLIKIYLKSSFPIHVNFAAFCTLTIFVEYFGSHVMHHSVLFAVCRRIDEDVEDLMTSIVIRAFRNDCESSFQGCLQSINVEKDCCKIVKKWCYLLQEGYLDWQKSSKLFIIMEKHEVHADLLATSIKNFITNYNLPQTIRRKLIIGIYNAVATNVIIGLRLNLPEKTLIKSSQEILETIFTHKKLMGNILRNLILSFHLLLISQCLRGSGYKPLLRLIFPLANTLKNMEDMQYVLKLLNQHREIIPHLVEEYATFIEQRETAGRGEKRVHDDII